MRRGSAARSCVTPWRTSSGGYGTHRARKPSPGPSEDTGAAPCAENVEQGRANARRVCDFVEFRGRRNVRGDPRARRAIGVDSRAALGMPHGAARRISCSVGRTSAHRFQDGGQCRAGRARYFAPRGVLQSGRIEQRDTPSGRSVDTRRDSVVASRRFPGQGAQRYREVARSIATTDEHSRECRSDSVWTTPGIVEAHGGVCVRTSGRHKGVRFVFQPSRPPRRRIAIGRTTSGGADGVGRRYRRYS